MILANELAEDMDRTGDGGDDSGPICRRRLVGRCCFCASGVRERMSFDERVRRAVEDCRGSVGNECGSGGNLGVGEGVEEVGAVSWQDTGATSGRTVSAIGRQLSAKDSSYV